MEYQCTKQETEHTTISITDAIVSKKNPQWHINKSVFIKGVSVTVQNELFTATS